MQSQSTTKQCRKCGETKPVSRFSRNQKAKDGLFNWCKTCANTYRKTNRESNNESARRHRENNRAKIRDAARAKRVAEPDKCRSHVKKYADANPLVVKVGNYIGNEIRYGRLPSASTQFCFVCGTCVEMGATMQWHHVDYSKPLEVIPVCASCHRRWHTSSLKD